MGEPLWRTRSNHSLGEYLPIVLVKEYYWCPYYTYMRLTLWQHKPTESMEYGRLEQAYHREDMINLVEKTIGDIEEAIWEAPVASKKLKLAGRIDLLVLQTSGRAVVVDAKAYPSTRKLKKHQGIQAQLAAYSIAVEETYHKPATTACIYITEKNKLHCINITPRHRRLVEYAAKRLWEIKKTGKPPREPPPEPWKCSTCPYKNICYWKKH